MKKVLPHDNGQEGHLARKMYRAIQHSDTTTLRDLLHQIRYDGHSSLYFHLSSSSRQTNKPRGQQAQQQQQQQENNQDESITFTPLKLVMRLGDAACLQVLLDYGCETLLDVTAGASSFSALHAACQKGQAACLQVLLEQQVDCNPNLLHGKPFLTPLHTVLLYWKQAIVTTTTTTTTDTTTTTTTTTTTYSSENDKQTSNNNNNQHHHQDESHNHQERYAECLTLLLQCKADPDRVDYLGSNAMHFACAKGLTQAVLILLQHGGKCKLRRGKYTALHAAAASLQADLLHVLLQHASPQYTTGSVKKSIVNIRDGQGNTPLHMVCRHANTAAATTTDAQPAALCLLQAGADPNLRNFDGDTPLLLALRNWHGNKRTLVNTLLKFGSHANVNEYAGGTHKEKVLVEALLRHGQAIQQRQLIPRSDLRETVNCAQRAAWTPLHYACFYGDADLVQTLLLTRRGHNANPHKTDNRGRSPLGVSGLKLTAAGKRRGTGGLEMAARLAQSSDPLPMDGEDLSVANNFDQIHVHFSSQQPTVVSLLLAQRVAVTNLDAHGNLPLAFCCSNGDLTSIYQMVRAGAQQGLFQMAQDGSIRRGVSNGDGSDAPGCIIL